MFAPSGFAANREKEGLRLVILTTLTYTDLTAEGTRTPPERFQGSQVRGSGNPFVTGE
jgi:hypothetical protein